MRSTQGFRSVSALVRLLSAAAFAAVLLLDSSVHRSFGQSTPVVTISSAVPNELNPASGGAPQATPDQAAAFAWQEFIALNWPAATQTGRYDPPQAGRDQPSSKCGFGDLSAGCALLVWETFRSKVENFPGRGQPPGYVPRTSSLAASYGYDALPQYQYQKPVLPCDPSQANDPVPWVNLDETDQITLDNMHAGIVDPKQQQSSGNSMPTLIRFLAKANRTEYTYVAANQWWGGLSFNAIIQTKKFLRQQMKSPPAGGSDEVSLPVGTIEIKAGWRPLNKLEEMSGHFHTQTVRFYEAMGNPQDPTTPACYRDAVWGLVALHIIQKTASAPYFVYATFEQADNLLTKVGESVEDVDGNIVQSPGLTATSPQVCLSDPKPSGQGITPSTSGKVLLTDDPEQLIPAQCNPSPAANYCASPGSQLYYVNAAQHQPVPYSGKICVNQRDQPIPDYVIGANKSAHAAIADYLQKSGTKTAPWLFYKLVNVQYFPFDKIVTNPANPNGSVYVASRPFSATNPAPSSYYLANIVVETNRSLQLFSGTLSPDLTTQWNQDGTPHKNVYYGAANQATGQSYNMGGCMGCHAAQGQAQAGDFSVILARGRVSKPEFPAPETSRGAIAVPRNRSLTK